MRIGLFSDLHLAPFDMNRCTAEEGAILGLLDVLESRCDEIVVAGDLFDLSRPRRLLDWETQLALTREDHRCVIERLEAHRWVWGNHDRWLRHLGVPEQLTFESHGLRLLVEHGHRYDVGVKRVPGLEVAANWVAGWLVRAGVEPAAKAMGAVPTLVERFVEGPSASVAESLEAHGARAIIARNQADVVAMGHSHRLACASFGASAFVNTGSLCEGTIDWVEIDLARASIELWRDHRIMNRTELHVAKSMR